jgi:hypothetical protein
MSAEMYGDDWNPDLSQVDKDHRERASQFCRWCGSQLGATGSCPWCEDEA